MVRLDTHSAAPICGPAQEKLSQPSHSGSLLAPYEMIYDFLGAGKEHTFVFTSSGAEAVNQAHWCAFLELARKEGKCHFIASPFEDAATIQSLKRLEELGCFVKIAPVDATGRVDVEKLAALIGPRTAMISISWAQGLTGVVQPIEEIAAIAREKNALLHVDASYALGKIACRFDEIGIDYLTFSGDQIHSARGTGGLLIKAGRPAVALIVGGAEQAGLRGGLLDTPSFLALSQAASHASLCLDLMNLETARLRDRLETKLSAIGAIPLFADQLRLPNTAALLFPRVHAEALLYSLQRKGIAASIGGGNAPVLCRVLMASGVEELTAKTAMSFSLSRYTTEEEIDRAVSAIHEAVLSLQPLAEDLF